MRLQVVKISSQPGKGKKCISCIFLIIRNSCIPDFIPELFPFKDRFFKDTFPVKTAFFQYPL